MDLNSHTQISQEMKNEDSHSSIVPDVEKEHATLSISLEGEDQTIHSLESNGKINKEVNQCYLIFMETLILCLFFYIYQLVCYWL